MTPVQFLKTVTRAAHRDLESLPLVKLLAEGRVSRAEYGICLRVFEQLLLGRQKLLTTRVADGLSMPVFSGDHLGFIRADLLNLAGPSDPDTFALDFSWLENPTELAGVLYVVEGSSMGNAVLAKRLKPLNYPISFFTHAGQHVRTRWPLVQAWLNQCLADPKDRQIAADAAVRTFAMIHTLFQKQNLNSQVFL